jgi:hypothetical protein
MTTSPTQPKDHSELVSPAKPRTLATLLNAAACCILAVFVLAYCGGAFAPFIATTLCAQYGWSNAIGIYLAALAVVSLISVWLSSKVEMGDDLASNPLSAMAVTETSFPSTTLRRF